MFYLAGHDRLRHSARFEVRDHLAELSDADPLNIVGDLIDPLVGLFFDRRDSKTRTLFARAFDDQKRELPVAGDESEFHVEKVKRRSSSPLGIEMSRSKLNPSFSSRSFERSLFWVVIADSFLNPNL